MSALASTTIVGILWLVPHYKTKKATGLDRLVASLEGTCCAYTFLTMPLLKGLGMKIDLDCRFVTGSKKYHWFKIPGGGYWGVPQVDGAQEVWANHVIDQWTVRSDRSFGICRSFALARKLADKMA